MNVEVALIRPGATLYDEQQRLQGSLDLPLSARGRDEASALAQQLSNAGLAAVYCGPGESLRETAAAVGKAAGLRPRILDELRSLDQGLWQGLQLDEIRRRNIKLFRQWMDDPLTICPPQGEAVADAVARIKAAIKPIWKRHRDDFVGIVVADPLAQLLASILRGQARPQLDELIRTGSFERIEVSALVARNGTVPRATDDSNG